MVRFLTPLVAIVLFTASAARAVIHAVGWFARLAIRTLRGLALALAAAPTALTQPLRSARRHHDEGNDAQLSATVIARVRAATEPSAAPIPTRIVSD